MTSLAHDRYILDQSEGQEPTEHIVRKKTFIDVPDSNQGSYGSSQIQFNLSQLQHSSQYLDVKSSYLQVPISLNITTDHNLGLVFDPSSNESPVMIKSGIHNLINSVELYLGNQQVLSNQQMSLVPISYRLMSAYTTDAMHIHGKSMYMYDTTYDDVKFDGDVGLTHYSSMERNMSDVPDFTNDDDDFISKGAWTRLRNDYCERVSHQHYRVNIQATIPLVFLHESFFRSLPLLKGALLRMVISVNAPATCTWAAPFASDILAYKPTVVTPTGVIPFMLNIGVDENGAPKEKVASSGAMTISCQIGNREATTCSVRCAMYELTPAVERQLISNPVKSLVFDDVLTYQNLTVEPGNSASQHQITSGLARATGMLILPFPSRRANHDLSPFASPYCNCPNVVLPYSCVSNFNVFVSGAPLLSQNISYGYQQWLEHMKFFGGTDGNPVGALGELHSGLLSQKDWQRNPFIYVNLQNRTDEEFPIVRSYAVSFDNLSKFECQYFVVIFYQKTCQIEVTTGQLVLNV